jgi:hypothetical protein
MKTIIGTAIGVLAIGLVLVGVSLRASASNKAAAFAPSYTMAPNGAVAMPVADTLSPAAASGPVMVNCAPGQRALVRQVSMNGQPVSQVACVADPSFGLAADTTMATAPVAQPVVYRTVRTSDLAERRVVYQEPAPRRVVQPQRSSLKKQLLVIGGSTAAGAGIGGIVGGKKGALIGAALGGGASTIYEATKK